MPRIWLYPVLLIVALRFYGGVAEVLVENVPVPMQRIGTKDVFGKSGKPEVLLEMYGLDAKSIAEAAKTTIAKKNA